MSDEHDDNLEPILIEVEVPRSPEEAFRLFTESIATWWPLETHSIEEGRAELHFEGRVGGDIYERLSDGRRHVWGTVLDWQPWSYVTFTWHPGREPEGAQEVEIRFVATALGTRVSLVHRGWERAGIEGPILRAGYANGWVHVFSHCYATAAGVATGQEAS